MIKHFSFILLSMTMMFSAGCLIEDQPQKFSEIGNQAEALGEKVEDIGSQAETTAAVLAYSLQQADKITTSLEDITQKQMNQDQAGKMEAWMLNANQVLRKIDMGTSALKLAPGPQQGYAIGADGIVGGLIILSGAIGAFLHKRQKAKNAEEDRAIQAEAVKTMVRSTVQVPGIGKKILSSSSEPSVQGAIKEAHNQVVGG